MKLKIIYYLGDTVTLKSKFESGKAIIEDDFLSIEGKTTFHIRPENIQIVDMFRLQGLGRLIKVVTTDNKTLYLSVVRINILGYFAVVNFFQTGNLYKFLSQLRLKNTDL